jgi:CheY-like chemotaxis protein
MERNHPSHDANKGDSKMTHELTSSNTPVTVTAAATPSVSSTAPPVTNVTTPALPPAQSALLSLSEQEGDDSKREISVHLNIIESVLLLKSICSFMAMLINRAIDFTKVSSGFQLQPQYGTANLHEVMKWVIQCTSKSSNNGVAVELKPFPPEMCDHVITDTQWFSENVLCLVSNAQKFTTEGIIEISCRLLPKKDSEGVSTSSNLSSFFKNSLRHVDVLTGVGVVSPEDWMICVEVEDEGIGIPFEKREDLFQPFKQAQKRAGGTGLGLFSLSKRVESLGGRCGISDRLDKKRGCRFWFTVPYRPDEDAASLGIVPENPSHLFVSSEGSGTDSRVNEVITLLTERKKKTREAKEGKGKDGKGNGNDYDRGDGNRKSNKYKYAAEGGRERGEGWEEDGDYSLVYGDEDHENDNNEENEREILNEYIEHSISDNGLSSSTLSHRKNLPLLPNYIRINASVKPFNHESIPLGLENMEKQQQALASPKGALMSSVPSLSMTNAPLTPAVASASARDLEPLRSFRDDSPELDPLEAAALSSISSADQIATPPSLAAPSVVLPPPSLAAAVSSVPAAPVAPVVLKILLVEDSPLIQKTISRALIREGYEVDIAWNGSECLKMTRNTRYNVILMDLQMPIMDGLEACRRLRILEYEAKAKAEEAEDGTGAAGEAGERLWRRHLIIGISANGDDLARDDALSSGMDDFIPKPVAMSALKDSLKRHWKLLLLSS